MMPGCQPSLVKTDGTKNVGSSTGHRVHTTNPNDAWVGGNDVTGEGLHYSGGAETFVWRIAIKKKEGRGAEVFEGHVTLIR